uniref:U3 small nucleolar RNA-associated protein 6 N-terminal domain-containing protein n=1 Tax=Oncorhynchus tshawytscha TaxID=74940 RepID=A0AAZ3P314_ONCTS
MAEIVQQRIENRIPELEQLERVGLFSKKEVKSMLKRATALEYKLHRLIITKVDFIAYIQYEINVLELIKKRRSMLEGESVERFLAQYTLLQTGHI